MLFKENNRCLHSFHHALRLKALQYDDDNDDTIYLNTLYVMNV
jgi:hypothetical protein